MLVAHVRKGETCVEVNYTDIEQYLYDLKQRVIKNKYRIAFNRSKNMQIFTEYLISEKQIRKILLSLEVQHFSKRVQNEHPKYAQEILYIFGKSILLLPRFGGCKKNIPLYLKFNLLQDSQYLIVISLHYQEYPLTYPFRYRLAEENRLKIGG